MFNTAEPVDSLRLFDSAYSVNVKKAGDDTSLAAEQMNLAKVMEPVAAGMAESHPDPVDFAIACGAALGHLTKSRVDFRQDFMPYQGKKLMFERTLKALSISVTVMLLAVGLYFQLRLYTSNSYLNTLHQNIRNEYVAVFGKAPDNDKEMLSKLKGELIRVQKVKSGQLSASGEASVSAMLTYVLEALNKAPANMKVNIEFITVGSQSIVIAGETASRENTLALFNAIDAHEHLKTSQNTYDQQGGVDKFRVTILPKDSSKK